MANRIILLLCCCVTMFLHSCGNAVQQPAAVKAELKTTAPQAIGKDQDVLSLNERQMVLLFKALLQIDKKEGLGFTRVQAEELLPIVRKNSLKGELTQSDQSNIVAMLTQAQRRCYDELQKPAQYAGMDPASLESSQPEERERMIEAYERSRLGEWEQDGEPANEKARSTDSAEGNPAPSGGKNIEQLLLELLESKLRP